MQHLSEEQLQLLEWTKDQPISVYQLDHADRVVLKIADERDAIQKKTFTKWVNKHLKKHWRFIQAGKTVNDLFEDLQDGLNLLSLLEVLSGELLLRISTLVNLKSEKTAHSSQLTSCQVPTRERGRLRFHKVQNCNAALQFLKYRKIKVVNIRPEDIVDGNPKLTLGLIWTIILHFQISVNLAGSQGQGAAESRQVHEELNAREARNALLVWVRDVVKGYPGVSCKDFSRSWRDGLAFNALLHRYRPQLIDLRAARQRSNRENLEIAFSIAEKEFNVTRLLDPEDVDTPEPDDKSVITYVSSLYDVLSNTPPQLEQLRESRANLYVDQAVSLNNWMTQIISRMHRKYECSSARETQSLIRECASIRSDEMPRKLDVKNQLSELYYELENLYMNAPSVPVKEEIQPATLDRVWRLMIQALDNREQALHDDLRRCERLHPKAEATCRSVLVIDGRLNQLRDQMKQDEQRIRTVKNPYEAKHICDNYDTQLREIDITIRSTMTDARALRDARYYEAETIYRSVLEIEQKFITVKRFYQEGIIVQIAGKTFTAEERQIARRTEKISSTRLVDQREQTDDSQSDDTASYGSDGSYTSTSGLGLRSEANGVSPVVQIQSYNERGVSNTGLWINGKEVATGAGPGVPVNGKHGSHLVHGRSPHDNPGVPQNGDRRRSTSTTEAVLHSAEPPRNEPKSDGAKQSLGVYYFGAPNGSRRSSTDSAGSSVDGGRRGSSTQTNGQHTVDAEVQYQPPVDHAAVQRKARADALKEKANQVLIQLEAFSQQLTNLEEQCAELSTWVSQCHATLSDVKPINFSNVTSIQQALVDCAHLQKQISSKATDLNTLRTQIESARGQSKGLTALLNEHRAHMSTTPPSIYAQSSDLQTALASATAQFDQLNSEVVSKQQNLQCLVDLVTAYNAHHDEATGWMSVHERQINEAESLANDRHGLEMAKLRFGELERQIGEFQNPMDRLVSISGDVQMRTNNQADEMRSKQDKIMDRWEELKRAGSERMRALDSVAYFYHECELLHGWLLQKQKMLSVLGPVSYDAALLENQKQQVDVLLEELGGQRAIIDKLHEESGHLLSKSKETERSSLLGKLQAVDEIWLELRNQLETRRRQIENAGFAGQVFTESCQTLLEWLDGVRTMYERFVQGENGFDAHNQLQELEKIEAEVNGKAYLITNTENAAATLCEVLNNEVIASEIDSKLQNAKRQYSDLQKRNEGLKSGLQRSVKQGQQFELAYEEMSKWLGFMDDRVRPDVKVSALLDVVSHQLEAFEDVRHEVSRKEYEVHTLLNQGRELASKSPAGTSGRLDSLQTQWNDLNKRLTDRHQHLSQSVDLAKRYKVAVDVFTPWLSKAEHVCESFQPPKFRQTEINQQVEHVQELRSDISSHSGDLEAVQQNGSALLSVCDADVAAIRDEVDDLQQRWDHINDKTISRARSLEDIAHRLGDYEEAMATLQDALRHAEEKLAQAEDSQLDQKSMDKVIALKDDVESMKRQIDLVEDLGHGLVADGQGLNGDAGHIEEALVATRNRYQELDQSIGDTMEFLEKATAAVGRFVDELKQTERFVGELEDELDNMGPQGKDLETLGDQLVEMERFVGNIDVTAREVHDVEETLDDLVESSYVSNPEPWREQIDGMKDQLANLVLRSNNRETELKLASEKMEEFHNTLNSVMQSLSSGEDGEHVQLAPDTSGTQQIHQQFFRKLDGVLAALNSTADKLANCEPISALPGKLQKQMEDNNKLIADLAKRSEAYESAKRAANELAKLASGSTPEDGEAVGAIQDKLSNLDDMWDTILKETERRGRSLEDTYKISVKFWKELADVQALIKEFEAVLQSQEPPAVEVQTIRKQQDALLELKEEFSQTTQPDYEQCVSTGQELMVKCGEPDKPEVKKNMEDLDHAWGNITQLFMQRDTDLVEAMEKSMVFHGLLQSLLVFLEEAEDQLAGMGSIGADIEAVKRQMEQLKGFRAQMEPHTVDVESLITQADELMMKTSEEQAVVVQGPVEEIRERWDALCDQINERKKELEEALVHLGQFRHALDELVAWIGEKETGLDEYTIPSGDPKIIELELAKHKVLLNDLIANERTLDILNEAGSQIIEESEGGEDAAATSALLDDMNGKWQQLLQKADMKQTFLEEHLKEAESFQDEIQDLLNWLSEKDQHLMASRPVGGLPQTAKDQLANFMEVYNDLEANKSVVEQILKRGAEYLAMVPETNSVSLDHNLKTLKHRWDTAVTKANDRKIKLDIAVRDAVEFYDSLQGFTLWLSNAEKALSTAKPPSRVVDVVVQQIDEHKGFQDDLSQHLSVQNALDKKGTTLKYFSQKQDVVQIKNLLASVQQRWDKLVSASADRQRALNTAYTEGKEFSKHYQDMIEWMDGAEGQLDSVTGIPNDPEKIKVQLGKHKEFVKLMAGKQAALSGISKMGRILKESAAKGEQTAIQNMLVDLQKRWKTLGSKSAERQRKLEEALLFSGQLKDALTSMLDWLTKVEPLLDERLKVHGDLDTVKALDEQHKAVENDLSSRAGNIASVRTAARDLLKAAGEADPVMAKQVEELENKWGTVRELAGKRRERLNEAMRCAVEFHQVLYSLIEWLGATEMKIRVFKALPDDVKEVQMAVFEIHEQQSEMQARQVNYDTAMSLGAEIQSQPHPEAAATVRHWLKVLATRWQEVELLMRQREQRLKEHMASLEQSAEELEQLLVWFFSAEANLTAAQSEVLPEEVDSIQRLLHEHQEFETELYGKQPTVERLTAGKLQVEKEEPRRGVTTRRKEKVVFGNNGARDLFGRNRNVLQLAAERRERLSEQMAHAVELEKLQNFQFDDWRRRFVRFMNVKKLRVMDFFRRLDRDADGKLTREEFMDCILKSNFSTTPLEMEIVADIFDQNKDGYVDYPEFVHALKPDWRSTQNLTDADKIEDELTFQVQNCTCKHHYKVQHVGEGRYIFGESQKLRLVRILRSTVMVRVGGGWVALDEFLVKNDPCRAKGRTNIELREQFILPEGASQSMTPFKTKSHSLATTPLQTMGPITKIRGKSVHTTPWRQTNRRGSLETSSDPTGALGQRRPAPHMGHSQTDSHLHVSNGRTSSRPTSQRTSRVHSPERANHSASSQSHSNHSRSSSISNVSNPSLGTAAGPSKIPVRPANDAGAKKLNGHPRKR